MEEQIAAWLEREMYTTAAERDPAKPLIVDEGGMVSANPNFSEAAAREASYARRQEQLGTSFFVNFDPTCNLHQVDSQDGDVAREVICGELQNRLMTALDAQFPSDDDKWQKARQQILERIDVALCPNKQKGFNNGEVYLWIRGVPFHEEFIMKVVVAFKGQITENPIMVNFAGKQYEVLFYGWGFRYY